jgi:V-type H+-transporting ATPase subunit d
VISQNIEFGFLEGVVRGFKGELLKPQDYANLLQCDSLDGKL